MARKRVNSSDSSSSEDETTVVRGVRNANKNPLVQKSGGFKKRKAGSDSDDDDASILQLLTMLVRELL